MSISKTTTTTTTTTTEERLHQQLMGRFTNSVDPSYSQPTTIIDSLGQSDSSPYHSANALISSSSSSNLLLHSNHQLPSLLLPIPSQSNFHQFFNFDPDHQAELLRRRKLEARRSLSSNSIHQTLNSRASFSTAPQIRTRRQSNASSIASNATSPLPQQSTLSPQPDSRRLLRNGSPLAQVHRPSPLRSASTPTLNPSESEHDPNQTSSPPVPTLSKRSRQKLIKAEQENIKKELIKSERIRLNIPERRRSIWFNTISGASNLTEKENQSKSSNKKANQEERDPFRKSVLQIDDQTDSMKSTSITSPPKSQLQPITPISETKKKTSSTLSRLFGTLLSTHNHSKSISVVNPRSPILSNSHSNHSKRLTVIQSIKQSTIIKRRPVVPIFDHPNPTSEVLIPSKPSESLEEEEDASGESVPRIGNVKTGNAVMVLVVDSN